MISSNYNHYCTQTYQAAPGNKNQNLQEVINKCVDLTVAILKESQEEFESIIGKIVKDYKNHGVPKEIQATMLSPLNNIINNLKLQRTQLVNGNRTLFAENPNLVRMMLINMQPHIANIIDQRRNKISAERIQTFEQMQIQVTDLVEKLTPYC